MSNVKKPTPITSWYDEIDQVEYQCVTTDQAEAYANALAAEREQKTVDSIIDVIGDCHIDNHQLTEITERIRALIPKQ